MNRPTLDRLTDQPTLTVEIDGEAYHFSEISIDARGRLQALIRELVQHPIAAISGQLDGLAERDRNRLLDRAYKDALRWPPRLENPEGFEILMTSERGQVAVIHEALRVHRPDTTYEDAERVYRRMDRGLANERTRATRAGELYDAEAIPKRIFMHLFGKDEHLDGGDSPKGPGPATTSRSTGHSSSGPASNGSRCGSGTSAGTP